MDTHDQFVDLAAERVGGRAVLVNDEFFAPAANLLRPGRGVFIEGKFTERGKWMDGWESRRRREPGHDWCIVQLGLPGRIHNVLVDTHHFKGNHPQACSLEASNLPDGVEATPDQLAAADFVEIVPRSSLEPDSEHLLPVANQDSFTHVRLRIYPDGGVARLRIFGEVSALPPVEDSPIDLLSIEQGGVPVASSDAFFGEPIHLILPGRGLNMGDGWETRRRRGPGHDWVVLALGHVGVVDRLLVDTCHFKGNYPESCAVEGARIAPGTPPGDPVPESAWCSILPRTRLQADHEHWFDELAERGPFTHVRLSIFPDGGVSRLRVIGRSWEQEDA